VKPCIILYRPTSLKKHSFLHTNYLLKLRHIPELLEVNSKQLRRNVWLLGFSVQFSWFTAHYSTKMVKVKRTAKKTPSKDRINKSGHSMNPGNVTLLKFMHECECHRSTFSCDTVMSCPHIKPTILPPPRSMGFLHLNKSTMQNGKPRKSCLLSSYSQLDKDVSWLAASVIDDDGRCRSGRYRRWFGRTVSPASKAFNKFRPRRLRRPRHLIMVALCNRADHYIFILFLSSFFFFLA